jgi:hypothetical protein
MNRKDFNNYWIVTYDKDGNCTQLNHDNDKLALIAKLSADEVHYEKTTDWPMVGDDNDYLIVMSPKSKKQIIKWHNQYPGGSLVWDSGTCWQR